MKEQTIIKEFVGEECVGCSNVQPEQTCSRYRSPSVIWRRGYCPMVARAKKEDEGSKSSVKINPLKASKRSMKGV